MRENPRLMVTFADPHKNKYLAAQAQAQEVFDRAKMQELWTPYLKAWFKDGLDTPDLVLLKLEMQSVEFWDSPNSPAVKTLSPLKSIVSKDENFEPGRHEKVDLRH
ncbi:MAG: pyridoxamine 5'-phosphate oxidase family protein [Bdellovibrionales bacterium]